MRKLIFIIFCLTAVFASAQTGNDDLLHEGQARRQARKASSVKNDKAKYWIGKVPVQEGLVTFQRTITVPAKSQAQIVKALDEWLQGVVKKSELENSSNIVPQENSQGKVIASIGEMMYFKRKSWESDFTKFYYQITADCQDGQFTLTFNHLQYRYEEGREQGGDYITAEGWITDDAVFNKSKTKFLAEPGKFRRATIERMNELFEQAAAAVK